MKSKLTKLSLTALILVLLTGTGTNISAGEGKTGYREMTEEIGVFLSEALNLYRKGNIREAKSKAQTAYFQVFENLEGPIRTNISAQKNYELEEEFIAIRRMIRARQPLPELEKRIADFMKNLRATTETLETGMSAEFPASAQTDGSPASSPEGNTAGSWLKVKQDILNEIRQAVSLYEKGQTDSAVTKIQDAYFDIFEASGMERQMGTKNAEFKAELEGHFNAMVGQMKAGVTVAGIYATVAAMEKDLDKAAQMLLKGNDSPLTLFLYSLMIILREGIEAILIITAIMAYLLKTGHSDKLRVIYNGCFAALVLSLVTAILVKWVFKASAASQEVLEGGTMLLAAAVLFSVSYWLISKAEAEKWTSYIRGKIGDSLSSNSIKALWFAAFLAVYREGAETVLFYQALVSDVTAAGLTAVGAGFIGGSLLLAAIYLIMRYGAVRLPLRLFFLSTGTLIYYMAFVFAGKGMMELIEGKIIEPSLVSWMPTLPMAGIFPYRQTLLPQLFIALAALAALAAALWKRRRLTHRQE